MKRFAPMMAFLVLNVFGCGIQIGLGDRKSPESFLPGKPTANPPLFVNVIGGSGFDVPYQIGRSDGWLQSQQDVNVIRHAIDRYDGLALASDDTGHVFL